MQKVYLVIGASSDTGIAFIRKLNETSKEKVVVLAHYGHNKDMLLDLANQMEQIEMHLLNADLSDSDSVMNFVQTIRNLNVVPTHIVHLAATPFSYMRMKQWDEKKVQEDMQVQLFSLAQICKVFLPEMSKQHFGKVVIMLSSYTLSTPPKFMSNYITVKYALLGFMKSAAIEYADKGITINAVSPNMMETKFLNNLDERTIEMTANASTLKRNITVDETADAILFLCSESSSYMNGVNLNLSGGDYMP